MSVSIAEHSLRIFVIPLTVHYPITRVFHEPLFWSPRHIVVPKAIRRLRDCSFVSGKRIKRGYGFFSLLRIAITYRDCHLTVIRSLFDDYARAFMDRSRVTHEKMSKRGLSVLAFLVSLSRLCCRGDSAERIKCNKVQTKESRECRYHYGIDRPLYKVLRAYLLRLHRLLVPYWSLTPGF